MEYKDYYKVMGLTRDASQDEVKRAYRKLARKYHPDVSKESDAEAKFKELGEAYEVLKNPEKRAAYNQLGANWQGGQDFNPPPNWDEGFEFKGGGFSDDKATSFNDFFEHLFSQSGHQDHSKAHHTANASGSDSHAKIHIDLEDSFHGLTRNISLSAAELNPQGQLQVKHRSLNIKIPKGIKAGQHIKLAGQGNPGVNQGKPGDLFLEIVFNNHPLFRLVDTDIYMDLPVTPWEAALGTQITIPTPLGSVDLKIPPNSKQGGKLRLTGRGLPTQVPGHFYVILQLVLPAADSEKAKALYSKMHDELDFNPRDPLKIP